MLYIFTKKVENNKSMYMLNRDYDPGCVIATKVPYMV